VPAHTDHIVVPHCKLSSEEVEAAEVVALTVHTEGFCCTKSAEAEVEGVAVAVVDTDNFRSPEQLANAVEAVGEGA